jgi:beta-1,4-mannosyltransferase
MFTHRVAAALAEEYRAALAGQKGEAGRPNCVFLVDSTELATPGDSPALAASLARQLARHGFGVRLIGPNDWTSRHPEHSVLICDTPQVDPRRLHGDVHLIGWAHDRIDAWLTNPGLACYDALITSSVHAQRKLASTFFGPVHLIQPSFDAELFAPAPGRRRGNTPLDAGYLDRPGQYRRAAVTVANVAERDAGYGLIDSRTLESLGCGTPVLRSHATGLAAAGLEAVAVFHTAAERDAVARLANAGELDGVTAELGEVARTRHSIQVRVSEFIEVIEHLVANPPARQVIDFHPHYHSNPFQKLLYSGVHPRTEVAVGVSDILENPISRDPGGSLAGRVLHLHWLDRILQDSADAAEATLRLARFRETIADLTARGARLVWTVHNALPHDVRYRDLEIELCQFVADHADAIHVMSPHTIQATAEHYRLPPDKVVQIDHPSYDGAYPIVLDRETARGQLGIAPAEISLLFLGMIRQYKGVERLLDAFAIVEPHDARLRLDVVGRVDPPFSDTFVNRLTSSPRVSARPGFVPEHLLQRHLLAADVMVLPYERALNSGAAALAATFGLPIVAPDSLAFATMTGRGFTETFAPGNTDSLAEALWRARTTLTTRSARQAARAWAEERPPAQISRRLIDEVLAPAPAHSASQ